MNRHQSRRTTSQLNAWPPFDIHLINPDKSPLKWISKKQLNKSSKHTCNSRLKAKDKHPLLNFLTIGRPKCFLYAHKKMELARKWAKMGGGVDSELFDGLVWERESELSFNSQRHPRGAVSVKRRPKPIYALHLEQNEEVSHKLYDGKQYRVWRGFKQHLLKCFDWKRKPFHWSAACKGLGLSLAAKTISETACSEQVSAYDWCGFTFLSIVD